MPRTSSFFCLLGFLILFGMFSCSGDDCPINNTVQGKMAFRSKYGDEVFYGGQLTVRVVRPQGDSVVLNRKTGANEVLFPLSYVHVVDTFIFDYDGVVCDSIFVNHTNTPTLVSIDCGVAMFHTITSVRSTHYKIDSVVLKSSDVNYDERENIQVVYPTAD